MQPAARQWPYRQYTDDACPSILLYPPGGYFAEIQLLGAQVISWENERQEELLFLTGETDYRLQHPVRGGIPICFPTFYDNYDVDDYGFARTRMWRTEDLMDDAAFPAPPRDHAFVDFILDNMPDNFPDWPNHRATQVEGLERVDYVDYLNDHERFTEGPNPITFENEVDKVYLNTPDVITVRDRERRRTYTIHKDANLPEIVVWNPWEFEARRMSDLGDEEYREMVCVEAAAVESEITLNPDQEWTGTQRLSVEQF
ncbi:hypothetical protein ABFS83_14G096000 [Erythranthe nasuta]